MSKRSVYKEVALLLTLFMYEGTHIQILDYTCSNTCWVGMGGALVS